VPSAGELGVEVGEPAGDSSDAEVRRHVEHRCEFFGCAVELAAQQMGDRGADTDLRPGSPDVLFARCPACVGIGCCLDGCSRIAGPQQD
jgi:hypothetical protein